MGLQTDQEGGREETSRRDIVLTVLLAFIATSLGYALGVGNQVEQIPIILRQLDPGYLSGDFFVSTSVDFGPRFYFAWLIAFLCQSMSLPWTYFVFKLLTDAALVVVTLWAARRIVGSSRLGGMFAAVLVLGVSAFNLGDATQIRYQVFQPASLAIPATLWAIGLGLCGRPIVAALVASAASLAHPLYGVQGGGIALACAFAAIMRRTGSGGDRGAILVALPGTSIGAVILLVATFLFWWWPLQATTSGATLSSAELVDILGRFRSPHHYFPSSFRPQDYVTTGLFMTAMLFAFTQWSRSATPIHANLILIPPLIVLVSCVVGTVFTELWPVRLVLTLQTFRLLSLMKWIGYLLIGWQLGRYWSDPPNAVARPLVGMSLLSTGGTQPVVTTVAFALVRFFDRLPLALSGRAVLLAFATMSALLWVRFGSLSEGLFLVAALSLLTASLGRARLVRISGTVIAALLGLALAVNLSDQPMVPLKPLVPVFDLEDHRDAESQAARAAAAHTPENAIFVVPPAFGILRIVGRRAIVVDFKATPLQDEAMREWRDRVRFVYGEVQGGGFPALARLDEAYRTITDSHLLEIAVRYRATHAVLYADSTTALPVIHADSSYKVVKLTFP